MERESRSSRATAPICGGASAPARSRWRTWRACPPRRLLAGAARVCPATATCSRGHGRRQGRYSTAGISGKRSPGSSCGCAAPAGAKGCACWRPGRPTCTAAASMPGDACRTLCGAKSCRRSPWAPLRAATTRCRPAGRRRRCWPTGHGLTALLTWGLERRHRRWTTFSIACTRAPGGAARPSCGPAAGLALMASGPYLAWLPLELLVRLPGRPLSPLPLKFGRRRAVRPAWCCAARRRAWRRCAPCAT